LGVNVDGDFGNETRKAVANFQKRNGLKPDGVVGPLTMEKLTGKKIDTEKPEKEKKGNMYSMAKKYKNDPYFLYLNGEDQELFLFQKGKLVKTYDVSTGKNGFGFEKDSGKTPYGLLTIRRKDGANLPDNTLIVSGRGVKKKDGEYLKLPTCDSMTDRIFRGLKKLKQFIIPGDLSQEEDAYLTCEAHVLTRSLVLDSARGIYIHGTNHENSLGRPMSGGCIRMLNSDVKDLFNKVPVGTKIFIQK
jgi:L,D-transpeptidase YbiS